MMYISQDLMRAVQNVVVKILNPEISFEELI